MYDYLIVGAGMFGATFAHCARMSQKSVLIIDVRDHIGGNCHTYEQDGIHVHAYGPHIFHTSSERIWSFINQFATFRPYFHKVVAINGSHTYSLPINLQTLYQVFETRSEEETLRRFEAAKVPIKKPANLEEWALSQVGVELYEKLIRDYTIKQWGRQPSQLPANIIRRLPIRLTLNDNYYNDAFQGIPEGGYTKLFHQMLRGCDVVTGIDYFSQRTDLERVSRRTVYTGMIDEFYEHHFGPLEYRSLVFETKVLKQPDFQGRVQVNYTSLDVPWTRIVEHKHFEPLNVDTTVVTWERSCAWKPGLIPSYPINDEPNEELYMRYRALASREPRTLFGGRLASYKYRDMHQVIAEALALARKEGLSVP